MKYNGFLIQQAKISYEMKSFFLPGAVQCQPELTQWSVPSETATLTESTYTVQSKACMGCKRGRGFVKA